MKEKCIPSQIYEKIVKPGDGPISRYMNRKISVRITCFLINRGIIPSPNTVTFFSILLGLLSALFTIHYPLIGGVLVQLSSIIDGVDGEIARLTGRTSRKGAFLDSVLDRLVDIAVIFAASLLLYHIVSGIFVLIFSLWLMSSAIMVSYIHARAEASLGYKLQVKGFGVFAGRDVRLFLFAIGFISYSFNHLVYLIIILFITFLSTFYVGYKVFYVALIES